MATGEIDWLLVMTNLASGAWTWAEAEAYTGMPRAAIEAAIHAAKLGGAPWAARHADLAVRIITRYGLRSGATLLSWPALLALVAILGAIGGGAYMYSNWGKPSSEPVVAGSAMNRSPADIERKRAENERVNVTRTAGQRSTATGKTWKLVQTQEDPGKFTQRTPEVYQGKDLGGYEAWTLGANKMQYDAHLLDARGKLQSDSHQQWAFEAPPAELTPGQEFTVKITGTASGSQHDGARNTSAWLGASGLEFLAVEQMAAGKEISTDTHVWLGKSGNELRLQASYEAKLRVPDNAADEIILQQRCTTPGGYGSAAEFKYKREQP